MIALSVRQPYAELILRGEKRIEYRKVPTNFPKRVYIYAALRPRSTDAFAIADAAPGDLPTGVIVGTVEIVDCRKTRRGYEWDLARPARAKRKLKPRRKPQPVWFYPFGSEKGSRAGGRRG